MVGHIAALQMASASSRGGAALKLEPGMEVSAKVVSSGPDNILRLAVGKQTVDVQASTALPKGTEVTLKVSGDAARPQIQIQISPSTAGTSQGAPPQQAGSSGASPPPQASPSGPNPQQPPASQMSSQSASQRPTQSQAQTSLPTQAGVTSGQTRAPVTTQILTLPQTAALPQVAASSSQVPSSSSAVPSGLAVSVSSAQAAPVGQTPAQAPGGAPTASGTPTTSPSAPPSASTSASGLQTTAGSPPVTAPAPAPVSGTVPPPTGTAPSPLQGSAQPATGAPTAQVTTAAPATGAAGVGANLQASLIGPQTGSASTPNAPAQSSASPQSALPSVGGSSVGGSSVGGSGVSGAGSGGSGVVPTPPLASPQGGAASVPTSAQTVAVLPSGSGAVAGQGGGGPALPQTSPQTPLQAPLPGASSGVAQTAQLSQAGGSPAPSGQASPVSSSAPGTVAASPNAQSSAASRPTAVGQPVPLTPDAKPPLPTTSAPLTASVSQNSQGSQSSQVGAQGSLMSQVSGRLIASYPPSVLAAGVDASRANRLPVSETLQVAANKLLPGLEIQQASLSGAFAQIGALSANVSAGKVSVPKPLQDVMQQILGLRLGGNTSVTGKTVAQSVATSGLFRENTQSASGKPAALDLKSLLVQLRGMLDGLGVKQMPVKPLVQPPVPGLRNGPTGQTPAAGASLHVVPDAEPEVQAQLTRLMQSTDSALARIRLSQMASRGLGQEDASSRPAGSARAMDVVMDLPFAVGQETAVLQMQIGRDPEHDQGEDDEEKAWRLRFGLDLTATGPVEAAVSLRGGGTYVSLWLEREDTHRNLSAQRDTIEAAFAHAGLDLQELRFIRGQPIRAKTTAGSRVDRQS